MANDMTPEQKKERILQCSRKMWKEMRAVCNELGVCDRCRDPHQPLETKTKCKRCEDYAKSHGANRYRKPVVKKTKARKKKAK